MTVNGVRAGAAFDCATPANRNTPVKNARRAPEINGRRAFFCDFVAAEVKLWVVDARVVGVVIALVGNELTAKDASFRFFLLNA